MPAPWQHCSGSAPRLITPPSRFGSLAAFVLMMCSVPAAGALVALFGVPPLWAPSVFEWAILATLVVLGSFLLLQVRFSLASSSFLAGLFGFVHGLEFSQALER